MNKNFITLNNDQLQEIQEFMNSDMPGALYGGFATEGSVEVRVIDVSPTQKRIDGNLVLFVHGDFDEEEQRPHWVHYNLHNGPVYNLVESDEINKRTGKPYLDWEPEDFYRETLSTKVLNMITDATWLD